MFQNTCRDAASRVATLFIMYECLPHACLIVDTMSSHGEHYMHVPQCGIPVAMAQKILCDGWLDPCLSPLAVDALPCDHVHVLSYGIIINFKIGYSSKYR